MANGLQVFIFIVIIVVIIAIAVFAAHERIVRNPLQNESLIPQREVLPPMSGQTVSSAPNGTGLN